MGVRQCPDTVMFKIPNKDFVDCKNSSFDMKIPIEVKIPPEHLANGNIVDYQII